MNRIQIIFTLICCCLQINVAADAPAPNTTLKPDGFFMVRVEQPNFQQPNFQQYHDQQHKNQQPVQLSTKNTYGLPPEQSWIKISVSENFAAMGYDWIHIIGDNLEVVELHHHDTMVELQDVRSHYSFSTFGAIRKYVGQIEIPDNVLKENHLFIKLQGEDNANFKIRFITDENLAQRNRLNFYIRGLFYGITIASILYALIGSIYMRSKDFLYFGVTATLMAMLQIAYDSSFGLYGKTIPSLGVSVYTLISLSFFSWIKFFSHILQISRAQPYQYASINIICVITLLITAAQFFISDEIGVKLLSSTSLFIVWLFPLFLCIKNAKRLGVLTAYPFIGIVLSFLITGINGNNGLIVGWLSTALDPDSIQKLSLSILNLSLFLGLGGQIAYLNRKFELAMNERKKRDFQLKLARNSANYADFSYQADSGVFHISEGANKIFPYIEDLNKAQKNTIPINNKYPSILLKKCQAAVKNHLTESIEEIKVEQDTEPSYIRLSLKHTSKARDEKAILVGTIVDITDQKTAEIALQENLQRWRDLAEASFEAILIIDNETIIEANGSCESILGYKDKNLINTNISTLISTERNQSLPELIEAATHSMIEMKIRKANNSYFDAEIRAKQSNAEGSAIYVITIRDVSERKSHETQLIKLGYYDSLTGLANRIMFQEKLSQALASSERGTKQHAILFIDLDQFKNVNDSLGHDIGDQLLIVVAKRIQAKVRKENTIARLGGDEFAVLIEDINAPHVAAQIANQILSNMGEIVNLDQHSLLVTPSIGIAIHPQDGTTSKDLLRNADTAMYHAKRKGRNNYQFYSKDQNKHVIKRIKIESELRQAIKKDEFFLLYQPKVDIYSGDIIGAEALVRWNSPTRGIVNPLEFIGIAEETGQIIPIGDIVLEKACKQLASWEKQKIFSGNIAVNISAIQFDHDDVDKKIHDSIFNTNIDPGRIELEITEGAIVKNPDYAIEVMRDIRDLGVTIALDDFGTGFSSLNYLKKFPVDTLKIDRSFVADMLSSDTDQHIAETIITLAHQLKLTVVAEGVETEEQLKVLKDLGCDQLQGYLFSPPVSTEDFEAMLHSQRNLYTNDDAENDTLVSRN